MSMVSLIRRAQFLVWIGSVGLLGCTSTASSVTPPPAPPPPPPPPPPAAVATVAVTAPTASLTVGATTQLTATTRDASGTTLTGRTVTWASANGSLASVSGTGLVTAIGPGGPVNVTATSEGVSGSVAITVTPIPVATVSVTATTSTLLVGGTTQLTATVKDATGQMLSGRTVSWSSSDATKASVSTSGLVTAIAAGGPVTVTATSEGQTGTTGITVTQVPVATIAVSGSATVGVGATATFVATAKDASGNVLAGRTVTWASSNPGVATVNPATGVVTGVAAGGPVTITATSEGKSGTAQVGVVLVLSSIASGGFHSCGLTADGSAYCWGSNFAGQLGDGTTATHTAAVAAARGLHFSYIDVGFNTTCGVLVTTSVVYCWGLNEVSEYGDGTTTSQLLPTVAVGGMPMSVVSVQDFFSCSNTAAGADYCWGYASSTVLPATPAGSTNPNSVTSPGLVIQRALAGSSTVCGLTAAHVAYCWGANQGGGGGNGTVTPNQPTPMPVVTGLTFTQLSVSLFYTCGIATGGASYCWGRNSGTGAFGDGTMTDHLTPSPTSGGLTFKSIATAEQSTCGIATDGTAYCWGRNNVGQLGDGTTTDHYVPMPVAGTLKFSTVTAGPNTMCALTTAGVPYCWGDNGSNELGIGSAVANVTVPTAVVLP
jgi:uncharacterized protein YjdB